MSSARRHRRSARPTVAALLAILGALALAACGGSSTPYTTIPAKGAKKPTYARDTLYIYSSLPESGPQAASTQQIVNGIKTSLDDVNHYAGGYTIKYVPLDDSSRLTGTWSQGLTLRNATAASRNPDTVAYIGDLDSGATELSLPILNQAGIVQITPGSPYPGLTNTVAQQHVTQSTEPQSFYPRRNRSLLRLVPNDLVQAAAVVDEAKSLGCTHMTATTFGTGVDGPALTSAIAATTKSYEVAYVSSDAPGTKSSAYAKWVSSLQRQGVTCFALTGELAPEATALADEIHTLMPSAWVIGTSGLCSAAWTSPMRHALSADAASRTFCTSPALKFSDYFGADSLAGRFRATLGSDVKPDAYTVYGYQAAELVIEVLEDLEPGDDARRDVLGFLTGADGGPHFAGLAGTLNFDPAGNLSNSRYGLYQLTDGRLAFAKSIVPPHVLGAS